VAWSNRDGAGVPGGAAEAGARRGERRTRRLRRRLDLYMAQFGSATRGVARSAVV